MNGVLAFDAPSTEMSSVQGLPTFRGDVAFDIPSSASQDTRSMIQHAFHCDSRKERIHAK